MFNPGYSSIFIHNTYQCVSEAKYTEIQGKRLLKLYNFALPLSYSYHFRMGCSIEFCSMIVLHDVVFVCKKLLLI